MIRRSVTLSALAVLVTAATAQAQEGRAWERRSAPTEAPVTVFHSTHAVNLPTAETLQGGEWLFEISHRFLPAVSDGVDALWGFDGGVRNRIGLAYAATDRIMLGVLRTNWDDNLELDAKVRVAEGQGDGFAWMVGAMGGIAWNTQGPATADDNEMQAYGQLIANALIGSKLAVGVVPSLLHNPDIRAADTESVFAVGLNAQLYLSSQASLLAEWVISPEPSRVDAEQDHDGVAFGVELETGGHFFKVILTNQTLVNPTQVLGGATVPFEPDEWRVGFNITRILAF